MDRTRPSLRIGLMLAVFASVVCCLQSAAAATLNAENLRCEYLKDPLGIDVTRPRLSWELRAGVRPSSGAAGSDLPGALVSPYTTPHADVAAPEDGRTPAQSPAIPRGVKQHAYQVLVASSRSEEHTSELQSLRHL